MHELAARRVADDGGFALGDGEEFGIGGEHRVFGRPGDQEWCRARVRDSVRVVELDVVLLHQPAPAPGLGLDHAAELLG